MPHRSPDGGKGFLDQAAPDPTVRVDSGGAQLPPEETTRSAHGMIATAQAFVRDAVRSAHVRAM